MRKRIALVMIVSAVILSLCIMLYPALSTAYNSRHQSEIRYYHQSKVEDADNQKLEAMKAQAEAYNKLLHPISSENYTTEMLQAAAENYEEQLNLVGDGIMGYVVIPKIDVNLPIYHGTNDLILGVGAGHLMGTSLPIGGSGTHCVVTAHSGMASQKMFSDLPEIKKGDVFYLQVLGETLAYEVDAVHTVLPHDVSHLGIEPDEDQCTLVTCFPFGVNTHRLLVRGSRIPYEEAEQKAEAIGKTAPGNSIWEYQYLKGIFIGMGAAACMVLIFILCSKYRNRKSEN